MMQKFLISISAIILSTAFAMVPSVYAQGFIDGAVGSFIGADKIVPNPQISLGGQDLDFGPPIDCAAGQPCDIGWIGIYIGALYRLGIGVAAVLAVVMIMVGGFLWLISGGSPDKVGRAKEFIGSALTGLLIALFSFIILYTVNPRLVNLEPLQIKAPNEVGDSSPERQAQAIAARTASPRISGSGNTVNTGHTTLQDPHLELWSANHRNAMALILRQPGIQSASTYAGHDNDTHSHEHATDIWPTSTADGEAAAQWIRDNSEALGVRYIIYNERVWNTSNNYNDSSLTDFDTWRPYTDQSQGQNVNPHLDHIHVSFLP